MPSPTPNNTTPSISPSSIISILSSHPFAHLTMLDKIHGCIIGSALGDTIGLYTEFMTKQQSAHMYPLRRFQLVEPATELWPDGHRTRFAPCAWTDDTDQALLLMLSYIHSFTHPPASSPCQNPTPHALTSLPQDFASRLRIWVEQGLLALSRPPCGLGALVGSVVTNSSYLADPAGTATARWINSSRHVAPNGSLMRTHPIGVIGLTLPEEQTWELCCAVGATTHVDPRCTVACCIEVALVRGLLRGEVRDENDVDACMERCYTYVRWQPALMNPGGDATLSPAAISAHLDRAEFERHVYAHSLADLALDDAKTLGYVYKCLGAAVYLLRAAMRALASADAALAPDVRARLFEDLTVQLVMEGGDADTNGAAACALLGAYLGYANLPAHWTQGLKHREWLMGKTYRLAVASGVVEATKARTEATTEEAAESEADSISQSMLPPEQDEAPDGGKGLMTKDELERRWAELMAQIATRQLEAKARMRGEDKKKKGFAAWFS